MDITINEIILCLQNQLFKIKERMAALKSQEKDIERLIEKAVSGRVNEAEVLSALFAGDASTVPVVQPTKRKRFIAVTKEVGGETTESQETTANNSEAVSKPKKAGDSKTAKVIGFIAERPGTTSEEIFAWCVSQGIYENNSADQICLSTLLAGQKSRGKLFSRSEPGKKWHRYYADETAMPAVTEVSQTNVCRAEILPDPEVDGASTVSTEVAVETESVVTQQKECITAETQSPRPSVRPAPPEEEPLNPPCPNTYMPGTLNGDVFKFIWDNEGVTIDEIRQHIAVGTWGKSAAGNVHKNVEAMKNHHHIFHERQKRDGATVIVYKATRKDVAVSQMRQERQAKAREHSASANSQGLSGDKTSVEGPRTKKPHPPPRHLKIPSVQDDWSPAIIWLIKRLRRRCATVEFNMLCENAKIELTDFGWDLSTISSTVIENGMRKAALDLKESGRILMDAGGAILMPDSDDEVEEEPEDEESDGDKDLETLLSEDEEVPPKEEPPFIPPTKPPSFLGPAIEEGPRRQIALWRGKKQLNQAVREMSEVIRELMTDRDDFDNGNDIANAFLDEGSKNWEHNQQMSFRKLEALVCFTLKQMIARKEVGRDWEDFLILYDRNPEH